MNTQAPIVTTIIVFDERIRQINTPLPGPFKPLMLASMTGFQHQELCETVISKQD